jgi:regulator of cell morphogenesis and NO signaling
MKRLEQGRVINLNDLRADKLMEYIIDTHHSYMKNALCRFNMHSKIIVKLDFLIHPDVSMIIQLTQELKELLEQRMNFEEYILLPYIKKLMAMTRYSFNNLIDNPIKKIRSEHLKIAALLMKIRALSNNYIPSVNSSSALKLCYAQLFDLEQDVHKHAFLVENILFEKITELEKRKTNDAN